MSDQLFRFILEVYPMTVPNFPPRPQSLPASTRQGPRMDGAQQARPQVSQAGAGANSSGLMVKFRGLLSAGAARFGFNVSVPSQDAGAVSSRSTTATPGRSLLDQFRALLPGRPNRASPELRKLINNRFDNFLINPASERPTIFEKEAHTRFEALVDTSKKATGLETEVISVWREAYAERAVQTLEAQGLDVSKVSGLTDEPEIGLTVTDKFIVKSFSTFESGAAAYFDSFLTRKDNLDHPVKMAFEADAEYLELDGPRRTELEAAWSRGFSKCLLLTMMECKHKSDFSDVDAAKREAFFDKALAKMATIPAYTDNLGEAAPLAPRSGAASRMFERENRFSKIRSDLRSEMPHSSLSHVNVRRTRMKMFVDPNGFVKTEQYLKRELPKLSSDYRAAMALVPVDASAKVDALKHAVGRLAKGEEQFGEKDGPSPFNLQLAPWVLQMVPSGELDDTTVQRLERQVEKNALEIMELHAIMPSNVAADPYLRANVKYQLPSGGTCSSTWDIAIARAIETVLGRPDAPVGSHPQGG